MADTSIPPRLLDVLRGLPRVALAFSGGLDSRLLATCMRLAGCDVLLFHIAGFHVPQKDTAWALKWAAEQHFPLQMLRLHVLEDAGIATKERCYVCKTRILSAIRTRLQELGSKRSNERCRARAGEGPCQEASAGGDASADRVLCDGSNADDLGVFRPGRKALKEFGVVSPLELAAFTKKDIHALAASVGLAAPDQKPSPCLLTRFPYGVRPTVAVLQRLETAEARLEELFSAQGLAPFELRLRVLTEPLLQLSFDLAQAQAALRSDVRDILASCNFLPCRILTGRSVSGFFDRKEDPANDIEQLPVIQ